MCTHLLTFEETKRRSETIIIDLIEYSLYTCTVHEDINQIK